MNTLYRPALIESVEQAEALPQGTVAIRPRYFVCEKHLGVWRNTDAAVLSNRDMVGFTALVPIGAEEQWRASWPEDDAHQRCRDERTARLWEQQQDATAMSRLVTPWEEA